MTGAQESASYVAEEKGAVPVAVRTVAAVLFPVAATAAGNWSFEQGKDVVAGMVEPAGTEVHCVTAPCVAARKEVPVPTVLFVFLTEAVKPAWAGKAFKANKSKRADAMTAVTALLLLNMGLPFR